MKFESEASEIAMIWTPAAKNSEENKAAYKTAKKEAKGNVAIAKARTYDHLYADIDTTEGQKKVLRMAKEMENNSNDIFISQKRSSNLKTRECWWRI